MRLRSHVKLLELPLKRYATRPLFASQCHRNRYATSATERGPPKDIAILGGGITGLASAYFISQEFPQAKITIYEASERLGGWMRSEHVEVSGGRVLFESGARTLRPGRNSLATVWLIQQLGLAPDVVYTAKTAPAARNRFVYYPNHLVKMPAPGTRAFEAGYRMATEDAFSGVFWGALGEYFRPMRPDNLTDESVGSFISRRGDKRIAENLASAVLHGIYAGDVWQLSMKAILPTLWRMEGDYGSIANAIKEINSPSRAPDEVKEKMRSGQARPFGVALMPQREAEEIKELRQLQFAPDLEFAMQASSVYSFRNGLQQMISRLEEVLRNNKQISIKLNASIQDLKLEDGSATAVELETSSQGQSGKPNSKESKDMVISTLPSDTIGALIANKDPAFSMDPVTVMVVNLYFEESDLLPVEGFGYLIPQSLPFAQNPERALGVIFDSDAMKGQDTAKGTKVTVMLGGHWWDGWESFPSEQEGVNMARAVLARHLKITEKPSVTRARLQYRCIPQYKVGYEDRLVKIHNVLAKNFKGRLRVVGNSFNGVGVNDCIRAARSIAKGLHTRDSKWRFPETTGLNETLFDERPWVCAMI